MEHKIIQGGEKYLPFARSRIKALRAMGATYRTQRFAFSDGDVTVTVEGDQDYITINGGGSFADMESGVVDVFRTDSAYSSAFLAGILNSSDSTAAVQGGFTLPVPPSGFFEHKYTVTDGALGGTAYGTLVKNNGQEITGYLKNLNPTAARSFAPLAYTEAGVVVNKPDDDNLVQKKRCAVDCPPSIFTGKTRLWVQAMYGRNLYTYPDWQNPGAGVSKDKPLTPDLTLSIIAGTPPALSVPMYQSDKDAPKRFLTITTNTGVILMPDNSHWICTVNPTFAEFYPLRPSVTAGAWRSLVRDKSGNVHADIEAYVLSQSIPDFDNGQVVPFGKNYQCFSMGYGWHWNWSGTAADIVVNDDQYQYAPGKFCVESNHLRFVPTYDVDAKGITRWGGSIQGMAEHVVWHSYFGSSPIMWPAWSSGFYSKLMPSAYNPINVQASEGIFYAFYIGDALQVCKTKIVDVPGSTSVDMTPYYDITAVGGPQVVGEHGGHYFAKTTTPYKQVTYSGADVSVSYEGKSESGLQEKNYGGAWDGIEYAPPTYTPGGITLVEGYPPYTSTFIGWVNEQTWDGVSYFLDSNGFLQALVVYPYATTGIASSGAGALRRIGMTNETNTRSDSVGGNVKAMIPKWDSQAVIFSEGYSRETIESGRIVKSVTSTALMVATSLVRPSAVVDEWHNKYTYGSARGDTLVSTTTPSSMTTNEARFNNTYTGSAGKFDAGVTDDSNHYGNVSAGTGIFEAWSSALPTPLPPGVQAAPGTPLARCVLFSPEYKGFSGSFTAPEHNPVFVGWV